MTEGQFLMPTKSSLFDVKPLIGMVHLGALPGSPRSAETLGSIIGRAVQDARTLAEGCGH